MQRNSNEDVYEAIRRQQQSYRVARDENMKFQHRQAERERTDTPRREPQQFATRSAYTAPPKKQKKPFYKRGLFWFVAGFLLFPVLILSIGGDSSKEESQTERSAQVASQVVQTKSPESQVEGLDDQNSNEAAQPAVEVFEPTHAPDPTQAPVQTQAAAYAPTQNSKEIILNDGIIDCDISKCHVKYLRHEFVENLTGKLCVAVYYEFTNNSSKEKSFSYTVTDKAFQDGIELETSWFHVSDESHDSGAEIKPGVTVTVCSGFVLRNQTSNIDLEVREWITLKNEPEDKMVLSIR